MELGLSPHKLCSFLWFCILTADSTTFLLKRVIRLPSRREVPSCPRVLPNSPEFFGEITNSESDPEHLGWLYSTGVGARNTTTARDFYANRQANGAKQFIPLLQQDIGDACIKSPFCDKNVKYRTIDGFCNNLEFPEWGVTGVPLVRIVPGSYSNGKRSVRVAGGGTELPSPRLLHTLLLRSSAASVDKSVTYAAVSWGQLISHDTARIIDQLPEKGNGQCLCCSASRQQLSPSLQPANCLPIAVPDKDPFYSKFKANCLGFIRSMTTDDKNCLISPNQIITDVSHFVDASFVYGSRAKASTDLRTQTGGLLRSQIIGSAQFLPELEQKRRHCPLSKSCFDAGDDRVNQNPMLAVLQVMFLRLHNRLAPELSRLNPRWSDETVYQEARKIVVAAVQRISYTEYLPVLVSPQIIKLQNLSGTEGLVLDQYDKFLNPGTLVSFTSAAFRVLHTMIPADIKVFNERRQRVKTFRLSDVYFKPDLIVENGMFSSFVRGLTFQAAQKINSGFTKELLWFKITELLFKEKSGLGLDLVAADIMRGRDHGLPPYGQVRISCGLTRPKDFTDLEKDMSEETVKTLRQLYRSVDDIDLYVGAVLERPAPDSSVGPTLQCIIVEQFHRWKNGDRFFYTFKNNPGAFTAAQLAEVEKLSLAKIACIVSDIQFIQPNVFKRPDSGINKLVLCSSLDHMNLTKWAD